MFSAGITPRVMFSVMISMKEETKKDRWIEKVRTGPGTTCPCGLTITIRSLNPSADRKQQLWTGLR